jgi:Prokaryotic homologs of the JAB domain
MMREVLYLVGDRGEVLWRDASDSPVLLADSRARWEAIWARREELREIAHSHPIGPCAFSAEDDTTMAALVAALGRDLRFSVVAPSGMIAREAGVEVLVADEPAWAEALRHESGMTKEVT